MSYKHKTHKQAVAILSAIAKQKQLKPFEVIEDFASGGLEYVLDFWKRAYLIYGDKYNDVSRCPECNKFDLDYNPFLGDISELLAEIDFAQRFNTPEFTTDG
jgi:hypothetical protein